MQVNLSPQAQEVIQQLIAQGGFQSADEAVEYALEFLQDHRPTPGSLQAKIQAARDDVKAGHVTCIESDEELKEYFEEVKRKGQNGCHAHGFA
jgi:Arc/MetJ-type ribon-helix-helix transcriptional regulator